MRKKETKTKLRCEFTLVSNVDECLFEFDMMDIPGHKPRLQRSQVYRNVRVSHVDEQLAFVYLMLHEDWLAATRILNDTFQQALLDKQNPIDLSLYLRLFTFIRNRNDFFLFRLKPDGYYMCKSQSSWFRCRLLTKINSITNVNDLIHVHLIDWGMERQVFLQGLTILNQCRLDFQFSSV